MRRIVDFALSTCGAADQREKRNWGEKGIDQMEKNRSKIENFDLRRLRSEKMKKKPIRKSMFSPTWNIPGRLGSKRLCAARLGKINRKNRPDSDYVRLCLPEIATRWILGWR